MIRNPGTCGAYSIRPYLYGRKELFLRSILGYVKQLDPFFDPKNVHAESIILLFDQKNGHAKWQKRFSERCFWGMFLRYLF